MMAMAPKYGRVHTWNSSCVQNPIDELLFVNTAVYTVFAFGGPVNYPTAVYTRSMTGVFISLRLLLYMAVYTELQPERY